jgi:DNA-binding transcriptional MerR regulator
VKISEVCSKTGISKRSIHYYIQEGLISPVSNKHNGYFIFTEEDCRKLQTVRCLRNAGVSIADIRSIMANPATINYYLSIHLKKLRNELSLMQTTINSLNYILSKSPLHPSVSDILDLVSSAGIPDSSKTSVLDHFDSYDVSLTNKYLWGSFLNSEPFNDYQDFLWNKLQRLAQENYSDDYSKIEHYLCSLSNSSIDRTFAHTEQHHIYIAELTEKDYGSYSEQIKKQLHRISKNRVLVSAWKRNYDLFYAPTARIHSSQLGDIVAEISPFFASFKKNINEICKMVYDWLFRPEGSDCLALLNHTFGRCLDIQSCNHGQLESLASLSIIGYGE